MKYAATFGSGWQKVVNALLSESNVKVLNVYDGFILFESKELNISDYPFFNNIYYVIDSISIKSDDINKNISSLISKINIDFKEINNQLCNIKHRTFKIKAIKDSQPVKVDYHNLLGLEDKIRKNTSMTINNIPDIDFIFLQRSENELYFLMKLTNNRVTEKDLKPGSLRPELCYLLSSMANINDKDIILDPFCGSGAISREIIKHFKYNMMFASDADDEKVKLLKKEYKNNKKNYYIKVADATDITYIEDNFIDIIITDPPWNIFDKKDINMLDFYESMLKEFNRVLKNDGRIVVLMGNIDDFENALYKTNLFKIDNKLSVLINGKKANVYLLTK